jgi:hypothetical protein
MSIVLRVWAMVCGCLIFRLRVGAIGLRIVQIATDRGGSVLRFGNSVKMSSLAIQ